MLQPDSTEEFKRVIETALLAAPAPLPVSELRRLFEEAPADELQRGHEPRRARRPKTAQVPQFGSS